MTEKTKKILKIAALIVLPIAVSAVGYYAIYKPYRKRKDEEEARKEANEVVVTGAIKDEKGAVAPVVADGFPLKLGSRGENVKRLQRFLVKKGWNYDFSKPNSGYGTFGKQTLANVKRVFNKESVTLNELSTAEHTGKAVVGRNIGW